MTVQEISEIEQRTLDLEEIANDEKPTLVQAIEAILFVANEPVEIRALAQALQTSSKAVAQSIDLLTRDLRNSARGIRVQSGPDGITLVSAPEQSKHVEDFMGLAAHRKLSRSALETLSIIAYRQPTTRGQIEEIRGVGSDSALATLRLRGLVEPVGRASGPGRPLLFKTTQKFLSHFGLEKATDMPNLPDFIEIPISEIAEQLGMDESIIGKVINAPEESLTDLSQPKYGEAAGGS
jgi:segregation and condensation protein B